MFIHLLFLEGHYWVIFSPWAVDELLHKVAAHFLFLPVACKTCSLCILTNTAVTCPLHLLLFFLSFLEMLLFGWVSTLPQSNPSPAFLVVAFLLDSEWNHELIVVLTCFPRGILKFFVCALDAFLVTVIRYPTKDNTMGIYSVYSSGNAVHHGGGDRSGLVCGAH